MTFLRLPATSASSRLPHALWLVLAVTVAAAPVSAQTPVAQGRVYEAGDFSRFAPQTALDMLNQVPGFAIRQASDERGLGQATGNVLLNGQRISNKSDDILAQLRRVPASNVVRIEIRDGAATGVPGLSGLVANVVSKASSITGQWAYRPEFRARFTDPLLTRFETSLSGERGPIQYTLGLENQASHSGAGGDTLIYNGAGLLTEERFDVWTSVNNQPRASARFVFDGPGDAVGNLNAAFRDLRFDYDEDGRRRPVGGAPFDRDVEEYQDGADYEVGADYEFQWGVGRLKLIGLNRASTLDYQSVVTAEFSDGRPRQGDRYVLDSEDRESVLRGEYAWKAQGADLQFTVEGAFNSLDAAIRLFALDPTGEEQEIPFPNGVGRVQEKRYEVIGGYGRSLSDTLSFQLSGGAEYSELSQVGAGGLTRDFFRPKGQLTAVWRPSPETQVNLRLQRKVGQLDFYDFLASADLNSGTQSSGNPDLVPPQSWEVESEIVREHGAWGSSTIKVYGALIEDIVDIVPIGATGESIGNLDEAQRYGVEVRATTTFDPIGWRGLKLDSQITLQRSQVADPLTGQDREISGSLKRDISFTLRHDVPSTDWAWGASLTHQKFAQTYRLTELSNLFEIPIGGSVFLEHKNVAGLTIRATAGNVFSGESYLYRTGYQGRRTDPIAFIERRDRTIGPIFSLDIRGRF